MMHDDFAKQCAKEALESMQPGTFKVTFDKLHRVAVVIYVLPYQKERAADVERYTTLFAATDQLREKWIHWTGSGCCRRARGNRALAYVFAAGPSQRAVIREVYEKALKRAAKQ